MRHIVGHFSDLSHQLFNTVKHSVEVFGQLVPFVLGPSKRYPLAEPALHDCSSSGVDGFDTADRAPRHRDTCDGGENECQCRPAGQGCLDDPHESIEIVEATADQKMRSV